MFKRLWSGLPEDPSFPSELDKLGYFVNENDEVRNIENPSFYFKYFLTKNDRHNERQRYAMNEACQNLVHERLEALGLTKVLCPLGMTEASVPHIPIFVSTGINERSRIVIILGESCQDLGILAHRVIGGPGGINKGSMVSIVQDLLAQSSTTDDPSPPGIILANMGQLYWHPGVKRALTMVGVNGAPMTSAVHAEMYLNQEAATIPGNRTRKEHVQYIMEKVVPAMAQPDAILQVVGIGDGADVVEQYLDWGVAWARLSSSLNAFAIVGGFHSVHSLQCEGFRNFLRQKARAWVVSQEPLDLILSGPDGNPNTAHFTDLGCAVVSAGEGTHVETALIESRNSVLAWLQEVALTKDYINPIMTSAYSDNNDLPVDDKWDVPEDQKWNPVKAAAAAAAAQEDAAMQDAKDVLEESAEDKHAEGEIQQPDANQHKA